MQIKIPSDIATRIDKIAKAKGVSAQDATDELAKIAFAKTLAALEGGRDTFISFTTSAYVKSRAASMASAKGMSLSLFVHELLAKEVRDDE